MGDRPIPAGLRELRGGRTRPHHNDTTPDETSALPPVDVDVPVPGDLEQPERRYWRQFAPLLAGAKMLTPADQQTLIAYCRACRWAAHYNRKLSAEWRRKQPRMNLVKTMDIEARGWTDKQLKLAGELGLTAVSRTRVNWSGGKQVLDPKERPTSKVAQLQAEARSLRRPVPVEKESQS